MILKTLLVLCGLLCLVSSLPDRRRDVGALAAEEVITQVRRPYSFAYSASRHYNGAPDREHTEERGNDGITRGVFRYVDPRQEVQEVIYTSDSDGFRIDHASNAPRDSAVVDAAKTKHHSLFEKIKKEHQKIGEDLVETSIKQREADAAKELVQKLIIEEQILRQEELVRREEELVRRAEEQLRRDKDQKIQDYKLAKAVEEDLRLRDEELVRRQEEQLRREEELRRRDEELERRAEVERLRIEEQERRDELVRLKKVEEEARLEVEMLIKEETEQRELNIQGSETVSQVAGGRYAEQRKQPQGVIYKRPISVQKTAASELPPRRRLTRLEKQQLAERKVEELVIKGQEDVQKQILIEQKLREEEQKRRIEELVRRAEEHDKRIEELNKREYELFTIREEEERRNKEEQIRRVEEDERRQEEEIRRDQLIRLRIEDRKRRAEFEKVRLAIEEGGNRRSGTHDRFQYRT